VAGEKLRVEQLEAAELETRHEIDERDLARVAGPRKHAFAEERASEMYAVEASDQLIVVPHLHRMAVAKSEEVGIEAANAAIDPRAAPSGPRRRAGSPEPSGKATSRSGSTTISRR